MRKTSNQIIHDIRLEKELSTFKYIKELRQAIDDFAGFKPNELEALVKIIELTKENPLLTEYVEEKIVSHYRLILSTLGITIEGFKDYVKYMEDEYKRYGEIRDKARERISKQPSQKLH